MCRIMAAPLAAVPLASLLLSLFISPISTSAADTRENQSSAKPMTIIISASRIEQPAENVGSSVTVLSGDELKARGKEFVADALSGVPSLSVTSYGTRGSTTQIRVRGNEANHVLVLVDGVRVSNTATGEYDFANMSLDAVDKIEVLLGPQSTLYGSDAIAGVISITTRKGGKGFGGHIQASTGSINTQSDFTQVFGGEDGWHYAITSSQYKTDGISAAAEKNGNTEKDGYDSDSLYVKTGYDHEKFNSRVTFNQSDSLFDFDASDYFGSGLAIDDSDNIQRVEEKTVSLVFTTPSNNRRFQELLQISSSTYGFNTETGDSYSTISERDTIEYQGSYKISNQHALQFGAESIKEMLGTTYTSSFGTSTFDKETRQRGAYLQWLLTIGFNDLSIGLRNDNHDAFGDHKTWRATANHRINNQLRVRGAYGTGFKAPGLLDLYSSFGGNANLQAEESSSKEIGLDYSGNSWQGALTAFNQRTSKLIRGVGGFPPILENTDTTDSHGVEINASTTWKNIEIESTLTWLDAEEVINGSTSKRQLVPDWNGNLSANYIYTKGRIWAEALYRDDRRDVKYVSTGNEDVTLNNYWLLNMGASIEISRRITLSGRIDNITDRKYEEIFSYGTRGRTGTVTADWRF